MAELHEHLLGFLAERRGTCVSAYIRTMVNHKYKTQYTTAQVRRGLKALEAAGKVKSNPCCYKVQKSWGLA